MNEHAFIVGEGGDGPNLVWRIDGAKLAALGDGDNEWLCTMFVTKAKGFGRNQFGRQFALGNRNSEELEATDAFRSAAFIGVNVSEGTADNGAPARHHGRESNNIGAGSVEDREDLSLRTKMLANGLR